jgi:dTDP-4-amino-4,6-dideoxygalactose transaminase
LHPLKTLNACGDGGVLTTNCKELYEKIVILRDNGLDKHRAVFWNANSRLDTLQAAILLVKLDYLEQWTEERRAHARFYMEQLKGIPQIELPREEKETRAVYHTFVIQAERRDELRSFLTERGVVTKIHYQVPIHLQPAGKALGYERGSLPVTESQAQKVISIPVSAQLNSEMLEYVVSTIRDFYER